MCTERKAAGEFILACFLFATMVFDIIWSNMKSRVHSSEETNMLNPLPATKQKASENVAF